MITRLKYFLIAPMLALLALGIALVMLPTDTQAQNPTISKKAASTVQLSDVLEYTIFLTNISPVTLTNVVITDTLPANAGFDSALGGTSAPSFNSGNRTVTFNFVTIPSPSTISVTLRVTATSGTQLANTNYGFKSTQNTVTTQGPPVFTEILGPVLQITKTGPATAQPGQPFEYILSVVNNGTLSASNVLITDAIPSGANFVSANLGGTLGGNVVSWPTIASLAPGAPAITRTLAVSSSPGVVSVTNNNYRVSSTKTSDTGPAVVTLISTPKLEISKSGPATATPGGTIQYTLTISNTGNEIAATNVLITDTRPTSTTFVSASDGGIQVGSVISWPIVSSLPAGSSIIRTFTVQVPQSVQSVHNIDYGAIAAGNLSATGPAVSTFMGNLQISKTGTMVADSNDNITYRIIVTNASPLTIANATIFDVVPNGATFDSSPQGSYNAGTNTVSWVLGNLTPNLPVISRTRTFVVKASQAIVNDNYRITGDADGPIIVSGAPVSTAHAEAATQRSPGDPDGEITVLNNGLSTTVHINTDAIDKTTGFGLNVVTTPPGNLQKGFKFFSLDAYQNGSLVSPLTLLEPISVTILYENTDVIGLDKSTIRLYYFNTANNSWQPIFEEAPVPCGVHTRFPAENKLVVNICHLTTFGIGGAPKSFLPIIVKN